MKKTVPLLVMIYATVVLLGGLFGFAAAHSLPSLIAGGSCGIALFLSGLGMRRGKAGARTLCLILSIGLSCFFAFRFFGAYKFFPNGIMTLLSIAVSILLLTTKKVLGPNAEDAYKS